MVACLLLTDTEVNEAEAQQLQQLIDMLHTHVHSSDVQVREWDTRTGLVRNVVTVDNA